MLTSRIVSCTAILILAAVTYATAVPIQMHDETLRLNGGVFAQPELAEALARSYAALAGTGDNVHVSHFPRQSRHGLDSLSGGTFGESKRFAPPRKSEWPNNINGLEVYEGSVKRNIDEIDRTGFDNFLKRNFDEIDRSGWDSFVKRRMIDSYLNNKQN